ncbi:MAG: ADP-ribosylglycohydrolase family protein [Dehalococcoidia bacterium]|nr:ADP-ribosylglycohydrolase family protein [Dehalococcoidia bacterium]
MPARTSETDPIRVDWLPVPWLGRVGLTFAPGKRQRHAASGAWERDLAADLHRLRDHYGCRHLVSLITPDERADLGIAGLARAADEAGIGFHHFPVVDQGVPADRAAFGELVSEIVGFAAAGEEVVIHCAGGLGRSGVAGGYVLRAAGLAVDDALAALREARGPHCPENGAQRAFIRDFAPAGPSARSKVMGAVMAAAVGDALGHPTEFVHDFSAVTGYELFWERGGARFAPYTDDTQMSEVVLRSLVAGGGFEAVMERMAAGFVEWRANPQGGHRAPGNACMAGTGQLSRGVPWREAGGAAAGGCGSVMRAYPFGLLFAHDLATAEEWAVEHSRMTHQAPLALAACAAMAVGTGLAFAGAEPDAQFAAMVEAAGRHDTGTATMAEDAVRRARAGESPQTVLRELEGWAAHEAIAAAMFVAARHPADLRAALLEGANAPGDSDSIATLAGALLGARLGLEVLPAEWLRDVERSAELRQLASEAAAVMAGRAAG